jgi:hypothetical protein
MTDEAFNPLGRPRSDQLCPPSCEIDTPESEAVQAQVAAKLTCPESRWCEPAGGAVEKT